MKHNWFFEIFVDSSLYNSSSAFFYINIISSFNLNIIKRPRGWWTFTHGASDRQLWYSRIKKIYTILVWIFSKTTLLFKYYNLQLSNKIIDTIFFSFRIFTVKCHDIPRKQKCKNIDIDIHSRTQNPKISINSKTVRGTRHMHTFRFVWPCRCWKWRRYICCRKIHAYLIRTGCERWKQKQIIDVTQWPRCLANVHINRIMLTLATADTIARHVYTGAYTKCYPIGVVQYFDESVTQLKS